jgi:hypothetical protein
MKTLRFKRKHPNYFQFGLRMGKEDHAKDQAGDVLASLKSLLPEYQIPYEGWLPYANGYVLGAQFSDRLANLEVDKVAAYLDRRTSLHNGFNRGFDDYVHGRHSLVRKATSGLIWDSDYGDLEDPEEWAEGYITGQKQAMHLESTGRLQTYLRVHGLR